MAEKKFVVCGHLTDKERHIDHDHFVGLDGLEIVDEEEINFAKCLKLAARDVQTKNTI